MASARVPSAIKSCQVISVICLVSNLFQIVKAPILDPEVKVIPSPSA